MVRNIHSAKVSATSHVVLIDDVAVGQDVGEGAFRTELAVSLNSVRRDVRSIEAGGVPL
jgi:hypothetical protein